MSRNSAPKVRADGTIAPSVFVTPTGISVDNRVLQAAANSVIIGISQSGMKNAPGLTGSDTAVAAAAADEIEIFGLGDICLLTIGSGGVTRGQLLVSDANGNGITLPTQATAVQNVGAIALESVAAGGLCRVQIVIFEVYPGVVNLDQTLTPALVAGNTSAEQSFVIASGLVTGSAVVVSPPSLTAGTGIVSARVIDSTHLGISWGNFTSGNLTPPAGTYRIRQIP
jgi:hypothetical protein